MKKITALTILYLLAFNFTFGQDREKYTELIDAAWRLYESKDYLKSGEKYSEAFVALGGNGTVEDRYNAACSWALADKPDSAFVQLFIVAENGRYANYEHVTTDANLNSLHKDERWAEVVKIVKATEAKLDEALVAILDTVYQEDQKYRWQSKAIEKKYGWDSKQMRELWETIKEKDKINLTKVTEILDAHGWLGPDVIGVQGNTTLFLVIQHSDMETQEKYLPMMREAAQKGDANANDLALLEDRLALKKGEKQIYGSQVGMNPKTGEYFVLPLIDPDNVDNRRAEVGLGSMQDYVSNWGMTWDVEEYKRNYKNYPKLKLSKRKYRKKTK